MKIRRFKVDKLIRDRLPEIMRQKGITVHERSMEKDEFIQRLKNKLLEEAEETKNTDNHDDLAEELADLLEVIQSLAHATGLNMQHLEKKRLEKRDLKGGFDGRIYNHAIDMEENNHAIDYYLKKSHQYPEINASSHNPECIFCQIGRRKKDVNFFAAFTHCYVIKDQFPVSNGHLLIIPYEHTENWFTAREEVRSEMMQALLLMKERLDKEYAPDGYNIGANIGETAGQTVMHLHLHLIPRYRGDMENPKGGVRGVIPSKQKY